MRHAARVVEAGVLRFLVAFAGAVGLLFVLRKVGVFQKA